ncbi:MAG: C_GCAxxG_C_C family protein [Alistipes sp.]|nr:C_GCAxxG_C_C family protein [Alistipes sp.]
MKVNIEERVAKARELFLGGYNCAQAVFIAYRDLAAIDEQTAATIAAPFGGGMGRLREVCGAVSGMTMCAGYLAPNALPNDNENKKKCYATVQELAEKFREENGSIVCRELLGLSQHKDNPTPSERTTEYYRKRPCVEYVATAARIVGEKINQNE